MPRTKSGLFDNRRYQNDYHRKLKRISITFNPKDPEDIRLYEYIKTKKNVTGSIKELIRSEIEELESLARAKQNAIEAEKSLVGMEFPLVDGFRDEEAIATATIEAHDLFIKIVYGFEIRIDLQTKKVLTIRRMYYEDHVPDRIKIVLNPD